MKNLHEGKDCTCYRSCKVKTPLYTFMQSEISQIIKNVLHQSSDTIRVDPMSNDRETLPVRDGFSPHKSQYLIWWHVFCKIG